MVSGVVKVLGGRRVLDGLDLSVPEGSLTAVLGPSGSGKTTLLRVIAGFEAADAGTISLDDVIVDGGEGAHVVAPRKRRIGYVPQQGALFPHLTVANNVGFGLRRADDRSRRIAEMVELVGLTGLEHRYPHQLSGGQQQRVALARALAVSPPLVLLDEPFASLDAGLRASVRADVVRILKRTATTAVLVTHDQDEALSCADCVAVLSEGQVVQQAAPHDLYLRPVNEEAARLVGEANLIDGTAEGSSVHTAFGRLSLLSGTAPFGEPTAVVVVVRPEQLEVSIGAGGASDAREAVSDAEAGISGRVMETRFYGHDRLVTVVPDRPGGPDRVTARAPASMDLGVGTKVTLLVSEPVHAWRPVEGGPSG